MQSFGAVGGRHQTETKPRFQFALFFKTLNKFSIDFSARNILANSAIVWRMKRNNVVNVCLTFFQSYFVSVYANYAKMTLFDGFRQF
jgi:hypothetical protein